MNERTPASRIRSPRYTSHAKRFASHGQREEEVVHRIPDGASVLPASRVQQPLANEGIDVALVHQDLDAADAAAAPGTVEAHAPGGGRRRASGNPGSGSGGVHLAHRV